MGEFWLWMSSFLNPLVVLQYSSYFAGFCGKIKVVVLKYKHLFLAQCSHQPLSYLSNLDSGKRVNPGKGEREREMLILWYAKKIS